METQVQTTENSPTAAAASEQGQNRVQDEQTFQSIPFRLLEQAKHRPNEDAYGTYSSSGWKMTSWLRYAEQVRLVARSLLALGVSESEKVCILGYNRPEWVLTDVAAMMINAVPAGIYTTCSPEEVAYIVRHSEARVVLVENEDQWQKIEVERENLPNLEKVIFMRGSSNDDPMTLTWEAFLALAETMEPARVQERMSRIRPDGVATLIYTSGTTGPPKAVMLSHGNLSWTAQVSADLLIVSPKDRTLSYLPLSHIAEQMFSIHVPITLGFTIHFARSMEQVPEDLKTVRPTVFLGVPRVWEKFRAKLVLALGEASGAKALIAKWAMGVGTKASPFLRTNRPMPITLRYQWQLANKLFYSKVKEKLGLDQLRVAVSGAAPLSEEVFEFFAQLSIVIQEVYGQSEASGPSTFNQTGRVRFDTVGEPIPGSEVKLGEDGEIMVNGPHVFLGYYKDEEATHDCLVDGWLHTGDLGAFEPDGHLRIVGRKKEIIITAGGKNIAPKNIESAIKDIPMVSQAVVIGDRRPFLSALITLDEEQTQKAMSGDGPAHLDAGVIEALDAKIQAEVNPRFARVEHVRKFHILPRDFSVEEGEMTPSMKLKRSVINKRYAPEIDAMYE